MKSSVGDRDRTFIQAQRTSVKMNIYQLIINKYKILIN